MTPMGDVHPKCTETAETALDGAEAGGRALGVAPKQENKLKF